MTYRNKNRGGQIREIGTAVILLLLILVCLTGCGNDVERAVSLKESKDETMMIDEYVNAYQDVDYRKMWKMWPKETFGGKVNVLADMRKDIFKLRYGDKAKLEIDRGEILKGTDEDIKKVLDYFSFADIKYVTDVYRCDYSAVLVGGKKDGRLLKEGIIYTFRFGGAWYVYDD